MAASAFLRSHEAIVSPTSAHVATKETGAIEATGHKVLTVASANGKLDPNAAAKVIAAHLDEHMVKPKMIVISQTTELGTVYTHAELLALRKLCDEHDMLLYMDGARLANAVFAADAGEELTLSKIAAIVDAFYIGGTKNGLLFGEALVICNPALQPDFRYHIKQRGGLLGKGFVMGIQFNALFEDDLFFELGQLANIKGKTLYTGLEKLGYDFVIPTQSNQVFPIVDAKNLEHLRQNILFNIWDKTDTEKIAIRFITTWKTTDEEINAVLKLMSSSGKA
jgi:threonine aldolase